jgi:hypothetical protein
MVMGEIERGTTTVAWSGSAPTTYDPDDMLGVRRALTVLPDADHDRFFDRWVALTERCDFDLRRIHEAVREELDADPGPGGLAGAWAAVDEAMTAYLGWRPVR